MLWMDLFLRHNFLFKINSILKQVVTHDEVYDFIFIKLRDYA